MASKDQLKPFLLEGAIYSTVPRWEDMYQDDGAGGNALRTIQEYYPNTGKGYLLSLEAHQKDPDDANSWIAQYKPPFGDNWVPAAKNFLSKLEFDWDDNPKHQYLFATNLSRDAKSVKIGNKYPDNWEMENFVISLLAGGQLSVWVRWYRDNPNNPPNTPDTYKSGYIWPGC